MRNQRERKSSVCRIQRFIASRFNSDQEEGISCGNFLAKEMESFQLSTELAWSFWELPRQVPEDLEEIKEILEMAERRKVRRSN